MLEENNERKNSQCTAQEYDVINKQSVLNFGIYSITYQYCVNKLDVMLTRNLHKVWGKNHDTCQLQRDGHKHTDISLHL